MANRRDGLFAAEGTDVNRPVLGGVTELLGNPDIRLEKPHTIIRFPGGNVEIARTSDGDYWCHVAVRGGHDETRGQIIRARMDHDGRYNDDGNAALNGAVEVGDVNHIAFLIRPGSRHA